MRYKFMGAVLGASLAVSGCSSRPRAFTPTLSAPLANQAVFDQAAFDRVSAECSRLLVAGKLDQNGRLASTGVGVAAGATVAAAGGAAAASAGMYAGAAVASATIVLLPFAIVGGAIGMAKIKRAKKERAIKAAMTGCLKEAGYSVTGWTKVGKRDRATVVAIAPVAPAPAAPRAN